MSVIRALGSLKFAVFLIAMLAVILSASTVLESVYGTPFAQKNFYSAHWFDFFLAFFWINIFCATWTRYPFGRKHIGFIITHIGILTLLAGAFWTRVAGVEGQMTVYEKEAKSQITQPGFTLTAASSGKPGEVFNLKSKASHLPFPLPLRDRETKLSVAEILEHANETRYLIETENPKPNAAVHLALSSELMGFHEKFTLIAADPDNSDSAKKDVGPARFVLKKNSAADQPMVTLVIKKQGSAPFRFELDDSAQSVIPVGNTGLQISKLHYYPHAKISENKLVNDPGGAPLNPAVEFEIREEAGLKETHTKFLLFPDFPSIRGGKTADFFHLEVALEAAFPEEKAGGVPTFFIYPSTENSWRYEIYSSKGLLKKGELKLHDKIQTGWRDISVQVLQMFNRAQVLKKIKPAENNAGGSFAVRLIQDDTGKTENYWLTENRPAVVRTKNGSLRLALEPVKAPLPFELTLKDFRKTDYPGTKSPASFESDVNLFDHAKKITVEKTIRMNQPLDWEGWRVFQSSYIQDPELGEASVFSIAKNPGTKLIYSGGIIILIGVIFLFYFHPFFQMSSPKSLIGDQTQK